MKLGDTILISGNGKEIKSRIEDMNESARTFFVYANPGELVVGKQYSLFITKPDGVSRGVGVVVGTQKPSESNIKGFEYHFIIVKAMKKLQKRNFVRHECHLPAVMQPILPKENLSSPVESYDGVAVNISAGGMKIATNARLTENLTLKISTKLNQAFLEVEGVILEIQPRRPSESAYRYAMRVKFINMRPRTEETIVKYIFEEYRKKRARERASL